ncbi:hypothetical protein [Klebsiella variicola]|uniref:hypothetical protein n=1 Tax=Klebsiella variicola TaxID=244366 RepID=UPI001BABAF7C|nr:hypothetical protein [Klebsiella variicola]MBR7393925.1 hypothetical protein [Klebsiella variicola]
MGHKFITACGCGVVKNGKIPRSPLRDDTAAIAGKLSEICSRSGVGKNCFWYYHAKAVCHRLRRRNLNAYNVLKQGTIAKADEYAGYQFHTRIIYHIDGKPVAYHANKKAARVH